MNEHVKVLRSFALTKNYLVRSQRWLDFIRQNNCAKCDAPAPSDPHHFLGSVHGLKSSDIFTIPLCRNCHNAEEGKLNETHTYIWATLAHEWIKKNLSKLTNNNDET